jgi:putative ABC transport system permease protein
VGVLPADFVFDDGGIDVWLPLVSTGEEQRDDRSVHVLGRLQPDVTRERARTEIEAAARRIGARDAASALNGGALLTGLQETWFDDEFRTAGGVGMAAALFVLLIACANVANLLLVRSVGQARELAVRAALGASRERLIRLLLVEAFVLAALGSALGVALARLGIRSIVVLVDPMWPGIQAMRVDYRVLGFAAVAAGVSALLAGLLPALRAARTDVERTLRENARGATAGPPARLRSVLSGIQVALAVLLLVCASLLAQSWRELRSRPLGFEPHGALTFRVGLPASRYGDDHRVRAITDALVERLGTLPGVTTAGAASHIPTRGAWRSTWRLPSEPPAAAAERAPVSFKAISPGYLEAAGKRLRDGRAFTSADDAAAPAVAIVNETMARRIAGGEDVLGHRIVIDSREREIAGVLRDVFIRGPDNPAPPVVYLPIAQSPAREPYFMLRTAGDPLEMVPALRAELARLDPDLPPAEIQPLTAVIDSWLGAVSDMTRILGVLAIAALAMAVVGVYAVLAHTVAQRRREIGVRFALGARSRDVSRLVVRQGMIVAAAGVLAGLLAAAAGTRVLSAFLHGVRPVDPLAFAASSVVLLLAALIACWLPARRAARVDPMESLRAD